MSLLSEPSVQILVSTSSGQLAAAGDAAELETPTCPFSMAMVKALLLGESREAFCLSALNPSSSRCEMG